MSDHWCGCQTYEPIEDLSSMEPLSQFIVSEANRLLLEENEKCFPLSLTKTLSASEQRNSGEVVVKDLVEIKQYLLQIEVNPSKALFEATVNYNTNSMQMSLIGEISRINLYGNQSNCIQNRVLKKYCFCKDFQIINNKK